jgi:hypothetical protein
MTEPKYHPGYQQARDAVEVMDEAALLSQIDALFGRDRLPGNYTIEQLRAEARRQTALDWLNPLHENYQTMIRLLVG